jgi:hypothetical protein
MDRIDAEITLSSFSRKDTEVLVQNRLRFNRIKGKFEDKPLIPFNEDFVDFIYQKSNGELRTIINLCSQVLDVGLEKEQNGWMPLSLKKRWRKGRPHKLLIFQT